MKRIIQLMSIILSISIITVTTLYAERVPESSSIDIDGKRYNIEKTTGNGSISAHIVSEDKKEDITVTKTDTNLTIEQNGKKVVISKEEIDKAILEASKANDDSVETEDETWRAKYKFNSSKEYKWSDVLYKCSFYKKSSGSGKKWKFIAKKGSKSKTRYGNSINVKWDRYRKAIQTAKKNADEACAEIGVGAFAAVVGSIVAMVASGGTLSVPIIVGMYLTFGGGVFTAAKDTYDTYCAVEDAKLYYDDI
jgi:hypothetical protein